MNKVGYWLRRLLPWIVGIGLVVIAFYAFRSWRSTIPAQPTEFYTPPNPLPAGEPGTIIRSEPITDHVPEGAQAWRVMYLSTGVDGEPVAVTGIVAAQESASNDPRPVVAWAHGTLGVVPACGTGHMDDPFQFIPEVERLLQEGFVLTATDYPGLGTPGVHPYLIGEVAAAAVLDSVRAARQLETAAGDRFAVWGHSQGGHSTLWTAQLAEAYAPELELVGAAAIAPATDLEGTLQSALNKRSGAILTSMAIVGWSENLPGVELETVVKPDALDQVRKVAGTCVTTPTAFLLLGELLAPADFLAVDVTAVEPYKSIIADNTPNRPIDVPLYIAHGTTDEIIPFEGSVREHEHRCAAGEDVELERYPLVGHLPVVDTSAINVIGWIQDRFAGRPSNSNCG